jgi:hypothetical protein
MIIILPCSCCACMVQHGNKTVYQSPTWCLCMTLQLIVAPTCFSTKGGGREMCCIGQRMPSLSQWLMQFTPPPTLYVIVKALWIIDDPMAILYD